jgi:hypothetical protein
MYDFGGQKVAGVTPKCSLCGATDHNVRTCKVENSDLLDQSVRCSNCRASGHNVRMRAYILHRELQTESTVHD